MQLFEAHALAFASRGEQELAAMKETSRFIQSRGKSSFGVCATVRLRSGPWKASRPQVQQLLDSACSQGRARSISFSLSACNWLQNIMPKQRIRSRHTADQPSQCCSCNLFTSQCPSGPDCPCLLQSMLS